MAGNSKDSEIRTYNRKGLKCVNLSSYFGNCVNRLYFNLRSFFILRFDYQLNTIMSERVSPTIIILPLLLYS